VENKCDREQLAPGRVLFSKHLSSGFEFQISSLFRISSFGFRIYLLPFPSIAPGTRNDTLRS